MIASGNKKKVAPSKNHHWIPVGFMKGFSIGFPETLFQPGRDHKFYWGIKGKCNIESDKAENHFFKKHLYTYYDSDGNRQDKIEKLLAAHDNQLLNTSIQLYNYFFDGDYKKKAVLPKQIKTNIIAFMKIGYKRSLHHMKTLVDAVEEKFPSERKELKKNMVLDLFINFGEGQHEGIPSVDEVLSKKGTKIFVIKSERKRFIMSDNLIFQLEEDGIANQNNELCFPLNEKIFILKTARINEKQYEIRELYDKDVDLIRFINERIVITAHSKIAGSNKPLLESLCRYIL